MKHNIPLKHLVSISHIGMEPKEDCAIIDEEDFSINLSYRYGTQECRLRSACEYLVSISHIGMEQQHLVVKKHYNTYILICQ